VAMKFTYTLVGSRRAPPAALSKLRALACALACRGAVGRSGGATGCDEQLELGVRDRYPGADCVGKFAYAMAGDTHPRWARMPDTSRALHARNVHAVLGAECDIPSDILVCWKPDAADGSLSRPTCSATGGTGQAIRVAAAHGVPVYNLASEFDEMVLADRLARELGVATEEWCLQ